MNPQIQDNLHLNQVLAFYDDAPPYIPTKFNTGGRNLMSRYVYMTVKRARNTQSIRDRIGLVRKRAAVADMEAYEKHRLRVGCVRAFVSVSEAQVSILALLRRFLALCAPQAFRFRSSRPPSPACRD
jgi:hypothetical protein